MASKSGAGTIPDVIAKPNLGQYVFAEKLGSGTYATVYKAYRKTGIREVVAIKCVLKSSLNKASTENLLTEIELLKNLKHDHIVTLKDFQWDQSYIYLIMEYCSGGDLSRFIRSKRALPEHIVKRFLQQIASAMKFLWDNNVAHMDLKPQNILLDSTSSPGLKLADFGFAKHLYDGDNLHVMRGSPLYMAPEIICHGSYDNRVDLWSIGVILFECLFGKPPFASKSFKELGEKIWDQKPVEIPPGFEVSGKARDLTLRLLQRDPDKRITFEEFFAHPFVDLEHIPSKHSLPNAVKLVEQAVKKDQAGQQKAAVRLYCEALDHFVPAILFEKSHQKKESLRAKVKQYMDRAEALKQLMKSQLQSSPSQSSSAPKSKGSKSTADNTSTPKSKSKPSITNSQPNSESKNIDKPNKSKTEEKKPGHSSTSSSEENPAEPSSPVSGDNATPNTSPENSPYSRTDSSNSENNGCQADCRDDSATYTRSMSHDVLDELMTLCSDSQELLAVLKLISAAHREEQQENFEQSLRHYEVALGGLLKILPNEPKGKRKDLLTSQVNRWMDKAERIKAYMDVQNLNTQDTSVEDEESENTYLSSQSMQCCVQ